MKQPKELSETDLIQITQKVRARMTNLHGPGRVMKFLSSDRGVVNSFLKQTYIAVREQLEQEPSDV